MPAGEVKLVIESIGKNSDINEVKQIYACTYPKGSAIRVYDIYLLQRPSPEADWSNLATADIDDFHATLYMDIQDYILAGGDPDLLSVHYFDNGEWIEEMAVLGVEEIDGITYLIFETNHFSYFVLLADEQDGTNEKESTPARIPGKVELTTLLHIPETGVRTTDMKSYLSIPEQWRQDTRLVEVWLDLQTVPGPYTQPAPAGLNVLKIFDVRLMQRVTDAAGQQTTREVDPQQIRHNITVMLPLSPSLAAQSDLKVATVGADGQMAFLSAQRQEIDGVTYLVVENNALYQLWVFGAESAVPGDATVAIPKTGDQDFNGAILCLLLLGGLALLLIRPKMKPGDTIQQP